MLSKSLGAIGLVGDDAHPNAEILMRAAAEPGEIFTTPQGQYKLIRFAGGGQLWLHLAPQAAAGEAGDAIARRIIGATPFHDGLGSVRVDVQSAIELDRNDTLSGGWVLTLPSLVHGDRPLPLVLEMVPFRLIETASVRFSANVRLLGLAAEASVYASPTAFLDRVPMAKLMSLGGVAPLTIGGGAEPKVAAASVLRCVALVTGRILSVRRITNTLTGQDYFWLCVSTDRGPINIVANAGVLLGALPAPGGILQAKARLVATLADRAHDMVPDPADSPPSVTSAAQAIPMSEELPELKRKVG